MTPQGFLANRIRAGGAEFSAFYTPYDVATPIGVTEAGVKLVKVLESITIKDIQESTEPELIIDKKEIKVSMQ